MKDDNSGKSIVFIVDDDPLMRNPSFAPRSVGLQVIIFGSHPGILQEKRPPLPLSSARHQASGESGLDFQADLASRNIRIPIIFMTGHGDIPMTVRAMKAARWNSDQAFSRTGHARCREACVERGSKPDRVEGFFRLIELRNPDPA
jgi:DNA-binding NtrC family response regulator